MNEWFVYVLIYKVLVVVVVLKKNLIEKFNEVMYYSKDDFVIYFLIIEKYVDIGMSLKEILEVVICYSDNIVGNILL